MFDLITRLLTSVYSLTAKLNVVQYTSPREVEEIREAWTRMDNDATVCRMALIGSESERSCLSQSILPPILTT